MLSCRRGFIHLHATHGSRYFGESRGEPEVQLDKRCARPHALSLHLLQSSPNNSDSACHAYGAPASAHAMSSQHPCGVRELSLSEPNPETAPNWSNLMQLGTPELCHSASAESNPITGQLDLSNSFQQSSNRFIGSS